MFGTLRAFFRRHGMFVDVAWIMPLVVFCLSGTGIYSRQWSGNAMAVSLGPRNYVLLTAALLALLFWRRRRTVAVFAIIAAAGFAQWLCHVDPIPANLAVLIAMYGVAARCQFRWAVAALIVTEAGAWMALSRYSGSQLPAFVSSWLFILALWIVGIYMNTRRRYLEGLEERAERAERERDQQVIIAAAAERARIARELHDVVAHNVSVMVVQADGAGYAIDTDPEQARDAVKAISAVGRQALAEMRRLVGVLRDGSGLPEEYAPQPGLGQLGDLVAQLRASGLPVELTINDVPDDLPEGEQLVVYRIVQEALTNTLKHGGPGAKAWVEVACKTYDMMLRVTDDGRGAGAARGVAGHGLVGMRERVAMYGGMVEAGPRIGGGFQVTARLPVSRVRERA